MQLAAIDVEEQVVKVLKRHPEAGKGSDGGDVLQASGDVVERPEMENITTWHRMDPLLHQAIRPPKESQRPGWGWLWRILAGGPSNA